MGMMIILLFHEWSIARITKYCECKYQSTRVDNDYRDSIIYCEYFTSTNHLCDFTTMLSSNRYYALRYWIAPVGTYFLLAVSKVLKDY